MTWGYKTVHFELKKEGLLGSGFLDESEIEQELNEFGLSGWELVSVLEVQDGIIVFFKQLLTAEKKHVPQQIVEEEIVNHVEAVEQLEEIPPEHEEEVGEEPVEENSVENSTTIGAIKIE